MRMRIAICVHNLSNGGAERVAALWAKGFAQRDDEVTVITAESKSQGDYQLPESVTVENISCTGGHLTRYCKNIYALRILLKEKKIDVAIAVMSPFDIWLPIASLGTKRAIINTLHWSLERPASNPLSKSMLFKTFVVSKLFPVVTVLTEEDCKIGRKYFKHCYAMPNPLAFEPVFEPSKKENIVFASGRLDSWHVKGFDTLLEAWGKVANSHPGWKLQIAGRGSEKAVKQMYDMIEKYGVKDSVTLLGFRSNIMEDYDRASIFAFTSRCDGFGMVLIEAMSRGCACVACDYKGRQAEIISSDEEGILCAPEDVKAVAAALARMMVDDEYRHQLQEGAARRAEHFSVTHIIQRWYDIFRNNGMV